MILEKADNVNPDTYCYETSIQFSEDFCKRLLADILKDPSFLMQRKKYLDPTKHLDEIFEKLNFFEKKQFMRRMHQYQEKYKDKTLIDFTQYFIPPDLEEEFNSLVPQWLKDIAPGEPRVGVQLSSGGDYLLPHKGHQRQSSLFMLLQGNGEETHWYRETGEFEVYDFFRVPDLNNIETIVRAQLQPFKWTLFNHKAWHSVHNFTPRGLRINIGIDFDSVPAEELLKIVKEHESK